MTGTTFTVKQVLFATTQLVFLNLFDSGVQVDTAGLHMIRLTSHIQVDVQAEEMEFPSVIICPKNPDALHMEQVREDMAEKLPWLSSANASRLLGYAIADAGFINMDRYVNKLTADEHVHMARLLTTWRGRRNVSHFYQDLFEKFGYHCEDVSHHTVS